MQETNASSPVGTLAPAVREKYISELIRGEREPFEAKVVIAGSIPFGSSTSGATLTVLPPVVHLDPRNPTVGTPLAVLAPIVAKHTLKR
jgi:hypothetical protein